MARQSLDMRDIELDVLRKRTAELERELAAATEEAQQATARLKAELLGTVSHELHSPLAAISGYAATLLRHDARLAPQERHEFLEAIVASAGRLRVRIDRLLEMAQFAAGQVALERAPLDLTGVAQEATEAAPAALSPARREQFSFHLHIAPGPAPIVLGDLRRLREVLDHLLENAVKYTPEGGPVVVSLRASPDVPAALLARRPALASAEVPTAGYVELVVRDSGVGIPVEHLERIFERFYQVDTSLTREAEGMGLGLALCERIVALHGGVIWAESSEGQGSAFHVLLPAAVAGMPA